MTAIESIPLKTIGEQDATLGDYAGKVRLVVNVASKCGLTPQYEALEALYKKYADKGFVVLGFPANDFGGQEPGTNEEIVAFCTTNFGVDFPMFSKVVATGPEKHPLYAALIAAQPKPVGESGQAMRDRLKGYGMTPTEEPEVLWNFEKFLIGRDGEVIGRFAAPMTPDDPQLIEAIEAALA